MRKSLTLLTLALAAAACSQQQAPNAYTLDGTLRGDAATADSICLYDIFGREQIAIVPIVDGAFHFEGTVDSACVVRLQIHRKIVLDAILEPGAMQVDPDERIVTGSPLNDEDVAFNRSMRELWKRAEADGTIDFEAEEKQLFDALMSRHHDDALGFHYFASRARYYYTLDEMEAFLQEAAPFIRNSEVVQETVEQKRLRQSTEVGRPYIDVEGTDAAHPERTLRLSDILAEGKPVLVDFWASWCGPCRQEMPTIRTYAEKYAGEVNVVGIAVWDNLDNTQRAVEELGLPWPVIFSSGGAASAYAVYGIPHVMLIAPDGTILARDLRGPAIDKAIAAALGK